ncbi:MAG: D-alanyl-D-alanine carboxypeptidase [Lachnospiraceae bacterium]|nr:D-alanyl-D-alanine carboxypeptidase [Lachnospiraceae bacterium]
MRYQNHLLAIGLSICLACGLPAFSILSYGDILVPPHPLTAGEDGAQGPKGGVPGVSMTGGPAVAGGQTSGGPSSGQQPSAGNPAAQPADSAQNSWQEPQIAAEGAVLIDGGTGKVLYGKNADQQFYPASITKVMTALLVIERCSLDEWVTFSASATENLEAGAVSLDIQAGDRLTVEQCLHGLLMKSANEIGNGLAEHVAGSVSGFADLMNSRARELGCTNTNFVNPHGLNDAAHKTTPHDMALIMRAALQQEHFRRIDMTLAYDFPATQKSAARTITMGHKMMYPSDSRYYEGIVGGKTGYTSLAGNTLVTGVEKNGVQLIVVIMKSKQSHYTDTKALLDYGFANYETLMAR